MIHLKNGYEVPYHRDFDHFFRSLLAALITQSKSVALRSQVSRQTNESSNDVFLRELMDNCIYVTHQLFEIAKSNEEFSRFMVTGFLFNSIILSLSQGEPETAPTEEIKTNVIH